MTRSERCVHGKQKHGCTVCCTEKATRSERCVHGKRIPHVHAGGTCLIPAREERRLTRPIHCPECAALGRPAVPARACEHIRAAGKAALERPKGEHGCAVCFAYHTHSHADGRNKKGGKLVKPARETPLAERVAQAGKWMEFLSKNLADRLGPSEVHGALTIILDRARWDQDTLDAVLRALELPFAARRQRLRVQPLDTIEDEIHEHRMKAARGEGKSTKKI